MLVTDLIVETINSYATAEMEKLQSPSRLIEGQAPPMEEELHDEPEKHGIDNIHGVEAEGEDQAADVHHGVMVEPARLPPNIDLKRAQAKKDEIRQLLLIRQP